MIFERVKEKDGLFYAQHRFMMFWIIPTPFWWTYYRIYGDIILREVIEEAIFDNYSECQYFIDEK